MKEFSFHIGADPEFNIVLQDKKVSAVELFKSIFKKYPAVGMGFKIKEYGNIGWDGCDSTAEMRPSPSKTVDGMVDNIKGMLEETSKFTQLFEFSAFSKYSSVGGHIHFELPPEICEELEASSGSSRFGDSKSKKVEKIFKKLALFYLLLIPNENELNRTIRKRGNYGDIVDHRVQRVSEGVWTLEFRAPSAEWLISEKVARGTLAYMATAYNEIINKGVKLKHVPRDGYEVIRHLEGLGDFPMLSNMRKEAIKTIKKSEYFKEYEKDILFILNTKRVLAEKEKCNFNILKGWNLYTKNVVNRRDFIGKKKVTDLSKQVNIEDYENVINIPYNDDSGVNNFVRALKHRVLANNMRLKNRYFLFGLRAQYPGILAINKNREFLAGDENIKTQSDGEIVTQIYQKMNARFPVDNAGNTQAKDDKEAQRYIIIGIPYEDRNENKTKDFLELVYKLEKDKIKGKKMKFEELAQTKEPSGIIYDIYNKPETRLRLSDSAVSNEEVQRIQEQINEDNS